MDISWIPFPKQQTHFYDRCLHCVFQKSLQLSFNPRTTNTTLVKSKHGEYKPKRIDFSSAIPRRSLCSRLARKKTTPRSTRGDGINLRLVIHFFHQRANRLNAHAWVFSWWVENIRRSHVHESLAGALPGVRPLASGAEAVGGRRKYIRIYLSIYIKFGGLAAHSFSTVARASLALEIVSTLTPQHSLVYFCSREFFLAGDQPGRAD